MTRIVQIGLLSVIAAAWACAVGCQDPASTAPPSAVANQPAKPTPEESFALIVETFKRGVENVPIGFVMHDSAGHTMMTGRNNVSERIIPPAEEGQPYKAIITVSSQSRYSIQREASESEDKDQQQNESQERDSFGEPLGDDGLEVFDRDLVSAGNSAEADRSSKSNSAERTDALVARQADKQEREYELLYQKGRWQLVTKLDPETEQSIQNAFDQALATQI